METTIPTKNIIDVLGVQGLMYNSYTIPQHKVFMCILKHAQCFIKNYVVHYRILHKHLPFTTEQRAAGHMDSHISLKEFGIKPQNYPWLKSVIINMGKMPVAIPAKVGNTTCYKMFDHLFTPSFYKNRKGVWMVRLRYSLPVIEYFYTFDKGVGTVDLNALNLMRNVASRKLYVILHCWVNHGYTDIKPERLMKMLNGPTPHFHYYSDFDSKQLLVAQQEIKSLYDKQLIDDYFTYTPFYADNVRKPLPDHITFNLHERRYQQDSKDYLSEKGYWQLQLKLKLINHYNVETKTAIDLSQHLSLEMVADLHNWFLHKDYFITKCESQGKRMNKPGYIVTGLRGFFHDKGAI